MRILFACNTPYQLLVSVRIKYCFFHEDDADVVLSDHITAGRELIETIKKENRIFSNVYYVESKQFYQITEEMSSSQRRQALRNDSFVEKYISLASGYDHFFVANDDPFQDFFFNYLKRKNRKMKVHWYEDGLSFYYNPENTRGTISYIWKDRLKKILSLPRMTASVQDYYVFSPDKIAWKPGHPVVTIPNFSKNADLCLKTLTDIFEGDNCLDEYNERFIFFEDGYMDYGENEDIHALDEVAKIVGKDNIIVKTHPRKSASRFKEAGYKTNLDTKIPWEVLCLKETMKEKVLLTMYSQAVVMPFVFFGAQSPAIILSELSSNSKKTDKYYEYMKQYYFCRNSPPFFIPVDANELNTILNSAT